MGQGAFLPVAGHLLCSFPPPAARRVLPCSPQRARRGSPRGARSSMSAPPPPPPRQASTAAALVAGLGAERAERARPAPSVFHVNNKYSHRRPRLVCVPRTPILRPRPFTPRGAGSRGRARARDRRSLGARRSPRGAGGGTPGAGAPEFRCRRAAPARAGGGHSVGGFRSALHPLSPRRCRDQKCR